MITRFRVKNYKALRDVELNLTPIHVLIGPNDTGKTSILEALGALCRSADKPLPDAFAGRWEGRELVWNGEVSEKGEVELYAAIDVDPLDYKLVCSFATSGRHVHVSEESVAPIGASRFPKTMGAHGVSESRVFVAGRNDPISAAFEPFRLVHRALSGVRLQRWVPELLKLPVAPYPRGRYGLEASGFGLALCLDDILGDDRMRFADLEKRFADVFPEIKQIKFRSEGGFKVAKATDSGVAILQSGEGKGLHFELKSGRVIPASQVSDGMMLVLAYLAVLKSAKPPRVLLVEEPENGVHPKRLEEVLTILRDLVKEQKHTQVVMTTHSPYVLDMFDPKEVTLCTKGDDGAISVRRLSESKKVREQIDIFTLGEIWTAEGDDELAKPAESDEDAKS